MRTGEAISYDIAQAAIEMRSLRDRVADASQDVDIGKAREELESLAKRSRELNRELAELSRPPAAGRGGSCLLTRESLLKAAAEQRSLVIGDIGAISQIRELFKEIAETDNILNYASYYYGPNAATNIPVLSPMGLPLNYAENAADVAIDDVATISVTEITPTAYARILPMSAEMIQMGTIDIESQAPDIFRQAFQEVMHRGMLTGTGSDKTMTGIFTSAKANTGGQTPTGTAGRITITELAGLALKIASKDASFRIIMNPSVYQGILSDTQDTQDIRVYKEGLIRDKTIEGVPVLLDAYAPSYEASGDVLAVACPLSRYAIGVAGELMIKPIELLQDTRTYYKALMFFSGKQVSDSDLYSLVSA